MKRGESLLVRVVSNSVENLQAGAGKGEKGQECGSMCELDVYLHNNIIIKRL
jgi:hypothetical protein